MRRQPTTKDARPLYDPLDFVVLRAPLLPVEFYEAMCGSTFDDEDLEEFLDDERVMSAINAASPELVRALLSPSKNERDRVRAKRKLRRYLIRMSTRPTPFGALAGVAIAPLGEQTTLHLDESALQHRRHLDVPWLLAFAHKIEADQEIFRQLRFQANPCALQRGGRVYIRELSPLCKNGQNVKDASLRASKMVIRALEAARIPISYETLFFCLATSPKASEEKIERFVTELWRQGFLLTDLRPPFTNGDPVRYLLERLKSLRGGEPYQFELERQLTMAEVPGFAEPTSTVQASRDELPEPKESKPRIHIDTAFSTSGALNAAVAKEAARAAELLLALTPWPTGLPYLPTYRQAFEDRYGTEREVPLLEMIDPEYGIGLPPAYDGKRPSPGGEQPSAQRIRREMLFDIASEANDQRRLEVEIDEETLQKLSTQTPNPERVPASLEINVFVSAASARDLDQGRFSVVVGPNVGALEGGRSLGRFAESLGSEGIKAYRSAVYAQESILVGKQCVELNFLPRKLELTNIIARPATRSFEINVGVQAGVTDDRVIPISDLMVGVHGGRFYVRSVRLNRLLNICSGHMANIDFAPAICRVLTDLMLDGTPMLRDLDWGPAFMLPFLPRVRVGRVVLGVAKWRLTDNTIKREFCLESHEAFRTSLTRWRCEWNVPLQVHFSEADNRLVLDLENPMDIEDLRNELRQRSDKTVTTLEEVYPTLADAWLPGARGRYVAEYVVPLVRHANKPPESSHIPGPSLLTPIAPAPEGTTVCRVKPPGSDWLYIQLYTAPSIEDDLLGGPVRELVGWAREHELIQKWFFVRYADPQPHIRLRFQGLPASLSGSLLSKVLNWAQALVKEDLCQRFAIDTYEPEIERYGGIDAIDLAEELFSLDSELTLRLLRFIESHGLRRVELTVFGLDFLFERLGCDFVRRRAILSPMTAARHESGAAYRERKWVFESLLGLRDVSPLADLISQMSRAVEPTGIAIADLGWKLRALNQEGRLTPPLDVICRSFAHMHCNRIGLDTTTEKLAYGLLMRSYDSLQAFPRKQMPNTCSSADTACG